MSEEPRHTVRDPGLDSQNEKDSGRAQTFWQWFAVAMLVICWLAEASMSGAREF